MRAIEDEDFPFERFSDIAESESWRKEVNRPIYHVHKWWAKRLGSVFRAIAIAALSPSGTDSFKRFYEPVRFPDAVVFDPFMGSGTTLGESLKIGARAIGRDINPVAYFLVKNGLGKHSRTDVVETFEDLEKTVAPKIKHFYQTKLPGGKLAEVLYYFWVKLVGCPTCDQEVELFSTYVFAAHWQPKKHPLAHVVCPDCKNVFSFDYHESSVCCGKCVLKFNPHEGAAKASRAFCNGCNTDFSIIEAVKKAGKAPGHKLYAKLVLLADGSKKYMAINQFDLSLVAEAEQLLKTRKAAYPIGAIAPGHNTNQVLNYCYSQWHEMFNARQLLCLSLLGDKIQKIQDPAVRDLFGCLFSGTLEFNNMFASFKGEGTGAVRHMFSHHILKPEKMPLEANLWGTPKSSGSFSTLFQSRIKTALDYAEKPFELRINAGHSEKIYGLSGDLSQQISESFKEFNGQKRLYLSCGDSSSTDIATGSVDAVITDPPFFDNVHYSELADFFYAWQKHLKLGKTTQISTRSTKEVQQKDAIAFTERLGAVFLETNRVLKEDGLLVFTYHHSRSDGWQCVLDAVVDAGFVITACHPIKAEMSVAAPKTQAKEPIDLDIIIVCRKNGASNQNSLAEGSMDGAIARARRQVVRLTKASRKLSRNDIRVILMSNLILCLSYQSNREQARVWLDENSREVERLIDDLNAGVSNV